MIHARQEREPPRGPNASEETTRDPELEAERAILCRACGHEITAAKERIAMSGSHRHTFVNPAAIEFTIGCFARAPGCAPAGEESAFWSWFPNYAWRMVVCAQCTAHLGWYFRAIGNGSETASFHGLVLNRLSDESISK
jgi:hypothetical protein